MWNQRRTDEFEGMTAELVTITGHGGDAVSAYLARPAGDGPFPGVVLVHHMPGWDELYREFTRRMADHGFAAICPNLYERFGHGTPEDVAAHARSEGGVADEVAVADFDAAREYLSGQGYCTGKVGIMGTCSGGRHAYLAACLTDGFGAVVDLWGGNVVMPAERLSEKQPTAPIDYTGQLSAPLLGLFGNDDSSPPPEEVDQHEDVLREHGKDYEFHRYDGAGHGFWYYDRPAYRQEQAMDAWNKTIAFFDKHLS